MALCAVSNETAWRKTERDTAFSGPGEALRLKALGLACFCRDLGMGIAYLPLWRECSPDGRNQSPADH